MNLLATYATCISLFIILNIACWRYVIRYNEETRKIYGEKLLDSMIDLQAERNNYLQLLILYQDLAEKIDKQ